jgi:hypothetical protein
MKFSRIPNNILLSDLVEAYLKSVEAKCVCKLNYVRFVVSSLREKYPSAQDLPLLK